MNEQKASGAIERLDRNFKRINGAVLVAMMAIMVALVFANVVGRYGFDRSFIWAEELSQYLMVWVTFLGGGLALRQGRHVAVELLQSAAPGNVAHGMRMFVALATIIFLLVLAVLGFQLAAFTWQQETPAMNISAGIPYLAVPVGALIFLAHFLLMFRDFVAQRYDPVESLEAGEE
ncbi:MAG TPA: TRAP transporter small permease [Xanthobacteraceae bacterium]|nr:TRAP transporter small permease [Xanthobacteraceae bacterium]